MKQDDLIDLIAEHFAQVGYEGTSLSRLVEITGLQRASLYHRYPGGKQAMALAAINRYGQRLEREVLAPLRDAPPLEPALVAWISGLRTFYGEGTRNCLLAALSLTADAEPFMAAIQGIQKRRISAIAVALTSSGVPPAAAAELAEMANVRIHGALSLTRLTGDLSVFRRVICALPEELIAASQRIRGPIRAFELQPLLCSGSLHRS